jgi:quinol monooxygenase YgiN|tara:strand:- start:44 stop:796 length:753 start_codon:yes stop_codon:yes gene_type:complete
MASLLTAALVARPAAALLPLWASEGAPWSRFERFTFESESKLNRFHSQFAPLLSSVQANESNMLSFAVLLSDEDPLSVMVLERYARSQAYYDGHCTTQAYLDFTPKLGRLQPNSSHSTYDELDIGFYGRNGTDSFTLTDSRLATAWSLAVELTFSSEAKVRQMVEAIVPLVDYIRESEPTTLGYKVMRGDEDPLKIMIMERYVDKDDAYLKVHRSSQQFMDFKGKLRELAPEVDGHSFNESPFLSVGPDR